MSGIVGIFQIDGDPVEEDVLSAMNESGRHRGPHRSGRMVRGAIGLAYSHLETGNDHVCSEQPYRHGHFQLVLDGRIEFTWSSRIGRLPVR